MKFTPNVGDVYLNKYEIVSLIGSGAFGCVYRARDMKLDRIVAIKFIDLGTNTMAQFSGELDAIKRLTHPNIVRLYDYDILQNQVPIMVMEFVDGREVGDVLADIGSFDPMRIALIAQQTLDALVETHKNGIIHCDLKPENIMLTNVGARNDVVKLIDFGVASLLSKAHSQGSHGQLVGTPQYIAPEQITQTNIGPWTDNYALGLILIELFTGHFVFNHDDPREILRMQLHTPVEVPPALLKQPLGPIIAKATQKDISQRYLSTQQFYDEVSQAISQMQAIGHAQPKPSSNHNVSDRRRAASSIFDDLASFGALPSSVRLDAGNVRAQTRTFDSALILKSIIKPKNQPDLAPHASSEPRKRRALTIDEINRSQIIANQSDPNEITNLGASTKQSTPGENTRQNIPAMDQTPTNLEAIPEDIEEFIHFDLSENDPSLEETRLGGLGLDETRISPPNLEKNLGVPNSEMTAVGDLGLDIPQLGDVEPQKSAARTSSKPEPELDLPKFEEPDFSSLEKAVEPTDTTKSDERPQIISADLSADNVKIVKNHKIVHTQAKTRAKEFKLIVACLVFVCVAGAVLYVLNSGLLTELGFVQAEEKTPPAVVKTINPESNPVAPEHVQYATLLEVSKQMAYVGAISGHLGAAKLIQQSKLYRIIGTPLDASVYVNDARVCAQTPCAVHIYNPAHVTLAIKKNNQTNSVDISKHDTKKPVLLTLSK